MAKVDQLLKIKSNLDRKNLLIAEFFPQIPSSMYERKRR